LAMRENEVDRVSNDRLVRMAAESNRHSTTAVGSTRVGLEIDDSNNRVLIPRAARRNSVDGLRGGRPMARPAILAGVPVTAHRVPWMFVLVDVCARLLEVIGIPMFRVDHTSEYSSHR